MNERRAPSVAKWPFFAGDIVLVGLAFWIVQHYPHPLPFWPATLVVACVAGAAALCVWPFRLEYQATMQLAEAGGLTDAVKEINNLQTVAEQIRLATGQWQGVQEHSAKTLAASKEISERIAAEAKAFAEFMQKANDSEKATLRLEVEKLRRGEGQWLQVLVNLLDHVFALYQAGSRSGQPNLEAQLGRFQEACRDVVRRVGLVPFEAQTNEPFDPAKHQLPDDDPPPAPDARVGQTLAAGYAFQGQLVRRSLVVVRSPGSEDGVSQGNAEAHPTGSAEAVTPAVATTPEATSPNTPQTPAPEATAVRTGEQAFRLEAEPLATTESDARQA